MFTSLLLAGMAQRGEVTLADPAANLPGSVKMPTRGGRDITLLDLASHTSGLPNVPSNFSPKNPGKPVRDITVDLGAWSPLGLILEELSRRPPVAGTVWKAKFQSLGRRRAEPAQ